MVTLTFRVCAPPDVVIIFPLLQHCDARLVEKYLTEARAIVAEPEGLTVAVDTRIVTFDQITHAARRFTTHVR